MRRSRGKPLKRILTRCSVKIDAASVAGDPTRWTHSSERVLIEFATFARDSWRKIAITTPEQAALGRLQGPSWCKRLISTIDFRHYWSRVEGGEEYSRSMILSRSCASGTHSSA